MNFHISESLGTSNFVPQKVTRSSTWDASENTYKLLNERTRRNPLSRYLASPNHLSSVNADGSFQTNVPTIASGKREREGEEIR